MRTRSLFFIILMLVVAACGNAASTGDTSSDPEAAQNLLPTISGYLRYDVDNIVNAITAAGGGASLVSGNAPAAAAVAKIDQMIQCFQDVGAVSANTYVQTDIASIATRGGIPAAGVLAVINTTRLQDNFMACALGGGDSGLRAQGATLEPCTGSGTITYRGDTISYLYAATSPDLCALFQGHFDSIQRNNQ